MKCRVCRDEFDQLNGPTSSGACRSCARKKLFAAFAKACGLKRYPDPTGERYVYRTNGDLDGKKSECVDFMDELWNALVRAENANSDLLLNRS